MGHKVPFQACHDGKCDTCKETKKLDVMVRKQYTKGLYECIDCKVEQEYNNEHVHKSDIEDHHIDEIKNKRAKEKILSWVFG